MIYDWLALLREKKHFQLFVVLVNKDLYRAAKVLLVVFLVIVFYLNNQFLGVNGLGIKGRHRRLQNVNRG